jgi:hypothetical protein
MTAVPDGLATALQDRYRLDRALGQGGMATVYLAHAYERGSAQAVFVTLDWFNHLGAL